MKTNDLCITAINEAVVWLDTNMPEWYKKIDLVKFNFLSPSRCIAGQLRLSLKTCPGFDSPLHTDHDDFDWSYAFMDTMWREIVKSRQNHAHNLS